MVHRPTFSVPSAPGLCAGPLPCFLLLVVDAPLAFVFFRFALGFPLDFIPEALTVVDNGEDSDEEEEASADAFFNIAAASGENPVKPASPLRAATAFERRGDSGEASARRSARPLDDRLGPTLILGAEDPASFFFLSVVFGLLAGPGDTSRSIRASAPVILSERLARWGIPTLPLMIERASYFRANCGDE